MARFAAGVALAVVVMVAADPTLRPSTPPTRPPTAPSPRPTSSTPQPTDLIRILEHDVHVSHIVVGRRFRIVSRQTTGPRSIRAKRPRATARNRCSILRQPVSSTSQSAPVMDMARRSPPRPSRPRRPSSRVQAGRGPRRRRRSRRTEQICVYNKVRLSPLGLVLAAVLLHVMQLRH